MCVRMFVCFSPSPCNFFCCPLDSLAVTVAVALAATVVMTLVVAAAVAVGFFGFNNTLYGGFLL